METNVCFFSLSFSPFCFFFFFSLSNAVSFIFQNSFFFSLFNFVLTHSTLHLFRWDEWVPESRVLKYTDENLKRQADLRDSMSAKNKANKSEKKISSSHDTGIEKGKKRGRDFNQEKVSIFMLTISVLT